MQEMREVLEADERVERVDVYENPENLMKDIDRGEKDFDAIVMDIELEKEENGIEYVKEIFQKAPEIPLIYVTGYHDRYAQQIFLNDANLAEYLMKPLDKEILGQYLDKVCQKRAQKHMLSFSVKGKLHVIGADSVLYLESDNHRVLIHTKEQMYSVYDKLSNYQKQLPASFIQAASGTTAYNVGIDAQRAGLVIKNSNVDISLIGGRTVGIGAGNTSANAEGRLTVENSTVKSKIAPTAAYSANMYFTDIIDRDNNYFYEGEEEIEESTFDKIFMEGYKRYQGNDKVIIISSEPLSDYCNLMSEIRPESATSPIGLGYTRLCGFSGF